MGNFINVVSQYERMALFTLGKFSGMRNPGFHILFWPIQTQVRVDLREEVLDIKGMGPTTVEKIELALKEEGN